MFLRTCTCCICGNIPAGQYPPQGGKYISRIDTDGVNIRPASIRRKAENIFHGPCHKKTPVRAIAAVQEFFDYRFILQLYFTAILYRFLLLAHTRGRNRGIYGRV